MSWQINKIGNYVFILFVFAGILLNNSCDKKLKQEAKNNIDYNKEIKEKKEILIKYVYVKTKDNYNIEHSRIKNKLIVFESNYIYNDSLVNEYSIENLNYDDLKKHLDSTEYSKLENWIQKINNPNITYHDFVNNDIELSNLIRDLSVENNKQDKKSNNFKDSLKGILSKIWNILKFVITFTLGIVVGIIGFTKYKSAKKKKNYSQDKMSDKDHSSFDGKNLRIEGLEKEKQLYKGKVEEQKIKIDELEHIIADHESNVKDNKPINYINKEENHTVQSYYIDLPERDGTYSNNSMKNHQDSIYSNYKLVVRSNNPNRGELYLLEDARFHNLLTNLSDYLEPFCTIENPLHRPKASSIKTFKRGIMIKRGDRWFIEEKLKLELV